MGKDTTNSERTPSERLTPKELEMTLGELVHRALLEISQMAEIQEGIREVGERLSKVTQTGKPSGDDSEEKKSM
jgi:hypothetical protein